MMTAQIDTDLSIEDYHSDDIHISKTDLALMLECPAVYRHYQDNGKEEQDSTALVLGNALHTLALEPESFTDRFYVLPETYTNDKGEEKPMRCDKRMQAYQDCLDEAGERDVLKTSDYEGIAQMAQAIHDDVFANAILSKSGLIESSIFFEHNGRNMKCRPDFMTDDGLIVDIKTARSAKPQVFASDAFNRHYDMSVAITEMGYQQLYGQMPDNYVFIVVEKESPYLVSCFDCYGVMDDLTGLTYAGIGRDRTNKALEKLDWCEENNIWPGYVEKIEPMKAPNWAINQWAE